MTWLLDINTLGYLFQGHSQVRGHYDQACHEDGGFILSPVVDYEIRRYLQLVGATRNLHQYEALIQNWFFAALDMNDWRRAGLLWAERQRAGWGNIEESQLLIAVTALRYDALLVTDQTRHFAGLGVITMDWTHA
jgi:predicted nucleic acid-binding protein